MQILESRFLETISHNFLHIILTPPIILIFPYIKLLIPEVCFDKVFHLKLSSFHNSKLYLALSNNYLTLFASKKWKKKKIITF